MVSQVEVLSDREKELLSNYDSRVFGFLRLQDPICDPSLPNLTHQSLLRKGVHFFEEELQRDSRRVHPTVYCRLGHYHLLLEEFSKALSAYQKFYSLQQVDYWKDAPFLYGLGIVYFNFAAYQWSIKTFQQVLYLDPGFSCSNEVHLRLGIMFKAQCNYEASVKHFHLALLDSNPCSLSKVESAISSSCSKWKWKGTILYYETRGIIHSEKVAAFDFDGTLAKTSLFQHGPDAWSVLYPNCLPKLAALNSSGYKLVIFTNQSAIGRAKSSREKTIAEKTSRLDGFINKAGLPFQAFIATTKDDSNFKPSTGMWQFMTDCCNDGISVDMRKSFYVGDAAGRTKDHSAADKNFAEKCGLTFYTETDYFSEQASSQPDTPKIHCISNEQQK